MRQRQTLRIVFLRLSIAFSTFTLGVCAYALWGPQLSTKIHKREVDVMTKLAQPASLQFNEPIVGPLSEPLSPFDPSGDYHPTCQITAESERSVQFVLEVRRRRQKLVAWGHLSSVGASYKFTSVSVTEKHLTFRTQKVKAVDYRFDGRFLGEGNFSEQFSGGVGSVMLEGTLQKFVNGQKVFEINTPFVHYPGC
jgi:hypothetical protein